MTTDTIPPDLAALLTDAAALLADAETVDLLRDVDRASDECEAESPRVLPLLRSLAAWTRAPTSPPAPVEAAPEWLTMSSLVQSGWRVLVERHRDNTQTGPTPEVARRLSEHAAYPHAPCYAPVEATAPVALDVEALTWAAPRLYSALCNQNGKLACRAADAIDAILARHRAPVEATREGTRTIAAIAEDVLACADSWAPGARLIGNVRADEVARLARYSAVCAAAPTIPPPPGPLSDEELLRPASAPDADNDRARVFRDAHDAFQQAARAYCHGRGEAWYSGQWVNRANLAGLRAVADRATAPLRAEIERLGIQAQDALDRAVKRTRAEERRIADDFARRATEAEAEVTRLRARATSDAPVVNADGSWYVQPGQWFAPLVTVGRYAVQVVDNGGWCDNDELSDGTRQAIAAALYRAPAKAGGGLTVGADLAHLLARIVLDHEAWGGSSGMFDLRERREAREWSRGILGLVGLVPTDGAGEGAP